ncbi:DNA repair protein RadC [Elstera sp.]|jgi:DNA repair protein RadC|uniref:RadC family protein n=1 Tax=Elstera sp. TaxID=1916664 RepID=UPI0037C0063A
MSAPDAEPGSSVEAPHYVGHRSRLRDRLLTGDADALPDYELLELVLFGANARGDVKPLAKKLLARFGSFAGVLTADPTQLAAVEGVGPVAIATLKTIQAAARRLAREQARTAPVLAGWQAVLDYCRIAMAHEPIEQVRLLFLDRKNHLIGDEVVQRGTIDHTPLYPRDVVKRALEVGATALILVHNHPTGDPTPSKADIDMTRTLARAAEGVGISLHDHLVIGRHGHSSFKALGLL